MDLPEKELSSDSGHSGSDDGTDKNSYSDYSDMDSDQEVIDETMRNRKAHLKRDRNSDSDKSNGSSDSEIEDSDDEGRGRSISRHQKVKDNWIVDSNNRAIEKRVIEISTALNQHLDGAHIEEAIRFFDDTSVDVSQDKQEISVNMKLSDFGESAPMEMRDDSFERECDQIGQIDKSFIKHIARWLMQKYFQNRDPRLMDSNSDDEEEEEPDHLGDSFYSKQKNILIRIISELIGIGGECKKTPQFIINYRSDIYHQDDSIFTDDDIYNIQEYCKKYSWINNRRQTVILPVSKEILDQNEGDNRKFVLEIMDQADEKMVFDDIQRYCGYLHSESGATANLRYFKDHELFHDLVSQFLIDPVSLAVSISGKFGADTRDPPEPDKQPEDLLRSFLDDHPEYDDMCTSEAEHRMAAIDADANADDSAPYKIVTALTILEKNVVKYASEALSVDPFLLYKLREQLTSHMIVNTSPTARGNTSDLLLPYGKYGPVKRLKGKLTSAFHNGDHWLLIDEARSSGLINVELDYEGGIESFFETLVVHYRSRYGSAYDELRSKILRRAFFKYIWPRFKAESEADLFSDAANYVKDCVESQLLSQLTAPPFTSRSSTDKISPLKSGCVLSFCYHPDNTKEISVVLVNSEGSIQKAHVYSSEIMNSQVDLTADGYANIQMKINECRNASDRSAIRSKADIYKMIHGRDVSIDVVVVAATCRRSCRLFEVAKSIIDFSNLRPAPPIIFAPADAALIYARSPLADQERRDLSPGNTVNDLIIIAASVARRVQNPLSELTRLCTPKRNWLIELPLHRFKHRLVSDESRRHVIYDACERACLKAVAISGVDITKLHSNHHTGPLQFVPGLGPVWSDYILGQLHGHSGGNIDNRDLFYYRIFKHDKRVIYTNAIPFLRFPSSVKEDRDSGNKDDSSSHMLDGTLIHPDDYDTANRLIHFFLNDSTHGSLSESKMRRFFGERRQIDSSHLGDYCSCTGSDRTDLLEFIARELSVGPYESLRFRVPDYVRDRNSGSGGRIRALSDFREYRQSILDDRNQYYRPMKDSELFEHLIHDDSICVDSVCQFHIHSATDSKIIASHSSGVDAISVAGQGRRVFSGDDDQIVGTHRSGVIRYVDICNMRVDVSFSAQDLAAARSFSASGQSRFDQSFDFEGEEEARVQAEIEEKNRPHKYSARNIDNDHFKNITYEEACSWLKEQDVGEYVFRPSTKGLEHLSLMMRFPGDAIGLFSIVERGKSASDVGIGRSLWIDSEEFHDLDEIYWYFIDPVHQNLDKIMRHHRWVDDRSTAVSEIRNDILSNPQMATYRLTVDPGVRNCVLLMWVSGGRVIEEPIRLFKDKLRYRHQEYSSITEIVNMWKQNARYVLPDATQHVIPRMVSESEEKKNEEKRRRASEYASSTQRNNW